MKLSDLRYVAILSAIAALCPVPAVAQKGDSASGSATVDSMANRVFNNLRVVSDMHWHKGEYCHLVNLNRMVLAAMPHEVDTWGSTGWILWSLDRDPEALALYESGIKANPHTYYVY